MTEAQVVTLETHLSSEARALHDALETVELDRSNRGDQAEGRSERYAALPRLDAEGGRLKGVLIIRQGNEYGRTATKEVNGSHQTYAFTEAGVQYSFYGVSGNSGRDIIVTDPDELQRMTQEVEAGIAWQQANRPDKSLAAKAMKLLGHQTK